MSPTAPPSPTAPTSGTAPTAGGPGAGPVIETQGLTKRFGDVTAVDALDLAVAAGEVFGFLGPNGAGKSTTIRLLLDLIRPTSGRALLFGLDVRAHAADLHRRVGVVPSDVALPPKMTALRYLAFREELRGVDVAEQRSVLAERLGADLNRRIGEMSTGNRQKIALIQALAPDPELVILDEPSRGLDPLVQHEVHQLLRERASRGATVFLSSHSLAEVDRTADRVGIIREGRLVTVEPLSSLKARVARTVELELAAPIDRARFGDLAEVDELVVDGQRVSARVRGSVDAFLRRAQAETEIVSVRSVDADLEDAFLDYYRHPSESGSSAPADRSAP